MDQIKSIATPKPGNHTFSHRKDQETNKSSDESSLPHMFQWLLASKSVNIPHEQGEMTDDLPNDKQASETKEKKDHHQEELLNLSWLQQLLNGELGGGNQSLLQSNVLSNLSDEEAVMAVNKLQSEFSLSQSASLDKTELQAITKEALAIIKTLVNVSSDDTPSNETNQQAVSASNDRKIAQAAQKLLKLLKQHGQMMQQAKTQSEIVPQADGVTQSERSTQEAALWKALVSAYDKRSQLTSKQHYSTEASISNQDVAKWIKQALMRSDGVQDDSSSPLPKVGVNTGSGSMSKVEQYVIHVQQNTGNQDPDKSLLDQFQRAVQSSRLFGQNDNIPRLNFSLRPEGLGDMTVKLAKVDGEMTVKIMVSSSAAHDMMEKNIHQLRHMFSPHHVTIERQDNQFTQTEDVQSGQEDDQNQEQDSDDETDQSDENDQQTSDEEGFQEELNDLLKEKA